MSDIKPNLDEQPRSTNLTDFDEAAMYESDHSTDSSDDDTANLKEVNPIIIFDSDDEEDDIEERQVGAGQHKPTLSSPVPPDLPVRNSEPYPPWAYTPQCTLNGQVIRNQDLVEIHDEDWSEGTHKRDFLFVASILRNLATDETHLRGLIIRRNSQLLGQIPHQRNEVCIIAHTDEEDNRPWYDQAQQEFPLAQVGKKRTLLIVSKDWPYPRAPMAHRPSRKNGRLVCRFIKIVTHKNQKNRQAAIENGTEARKAEIYRITSKVIAELKGWSKLQREKAQPGREERSRKKNSVDGTPQGLRRKSFSYDQLTRVDSTFSKRPQQFSSHQTSLSMDERRSYTFADICHGAGGVSRAATILGLLILWACDNDEKVANVYSKNFPLVHQYEMGAEELHLLTGPFTLTHVDILHLSLPCKYWSPAHTHESNTLRDGANRATLFVVKEILNKVKPRIVMFEQTFGLLTMEQKHGGYFQSLVQQIVEAGYDISWSIVNFKDYGLAQSRKRLVIYASRHDLEIPLPKFPEPTNTACFVNDVIRDLPISPYHQPHLAKRRSDPAYDGNTTRINTVTCSGTKFGYHPSGLRDFTMTELARLQGIPLVHQFEGSPAFVKQLIGDMVPTDAWITFLRQAVKVLEEHDAKFGSNRTSASVFSASFPGSSRSNPVDLDDVEDFSEISNVNKRSSPFHQSPTPVRFTPESPGAKRGNPLFQEWSTRHPKRAKSQLNNQPSTPIGEPGEASDVGATPRSSDSRSAVDFDDKNLEPM